MAYTLGNKCAKNLCKRTVLLQLIIKNVVMFFGTQCIVGMAGNVLKFVMVSVCLSVCLHSTCLQRRHAVAAAWQACHAAHCLV